MGDLKEVNHHCEKHGTHPVQVVFLSGGFLPSRCPICAEEKAAEEEETQKQLEEKRKVQQKQQAIKKKMNHSGVPTRFKTHSLDTFIPPTPEAKENLECCWHYAKNFEVMKSLGRCMIFTGTTGTGKTHLSCGIANYIIQEHMATPLFITALDMVRRVKQTYSKTSEETEADVIKFFMKPDLLIVDEIGVQFGSDAEKMIIFEIINKRYEELLPTFLLSNLAPAILSEFVGERIMDRMKENGGVMMTFSWPSKRGA